MNVIEHIYNIVLKILGFFFLLWKESWCTPGIQDHYICHCRKQTVSSIFCYIYACTQMMKL